MTASYADILVAVSILSLRFAPLFAFAAPFTLTRIPIVIRVLLGVALAAAAVGINPENTVTTLSTADGSWASRVSSAIALELLVGIAIAISIQWAYAAVLLAGRTVDVQAGFGLALLADPTSRNQIPLIGTLFGYAFGLSFFAAGGVGEVMALSIASLDALPLGAGIGDIAIGPLVAFIGGAFVIAMGLAGLTMLTLFLIDSTVAFLSRTLPQMNVLLIGFQVKTMAVLITLPLAMGMTGAIYLRLVRQALMTSGSLLGL